MKTKTELIDLCINDLKTMIVAIIVVFGIACIFIAFDEYNNNKNGKESNNNNSR